MRSLLCAVSAATCTLVAQDRADPAAALAALVGDPRLAGARVGVQVVDLADGTVVLRHDDDRGFMTASNMKLISSAVALVTLGPDFRFTSRLEARGAVDGEVLDGDLLLVGSGDPTFGGRHEVDGPRAVLARMATMLRDQHGVREVTGAVLGDDDCQPDEVMGEGWSWGYQGADYAAQPSGLCFAENVVRIELLATVAGRRPGYRLTPETAYVEIANDALAHDGPPSLRIERQRARNRVLLGGNLAAGKPHRDDFAVENPTAFAAFALRESLITAGIRVRGPARDLDDHGAPLPKERTVLCEEHSPPLHEILVTLNKVSQNLYAEQLVRAAARAAAGASHMTDAEKHAKQVLATLGVDTAGMVVADGSGLTRLNLVQPRQLAALLAAMWRHPRGETWRASLPIAGIDGTLAARFPEGHPARGRVRAKTGFISRVVALSGYVPRLGEGAAPLAFSILVNNFTCPTDDAKDAVDTFVGALVHLADQTK